VFVLRLIVSVVYTAAFFGLSLFLPAGTLAWWRAWVLLGAVLVGTVVTMLVVFRGNEGLLSERFGAPLQKGQPFWDKILVPLLVIAFGGLIVAIPLDVFRYHLLRRPGPVVSAAGLVLFVAGWTTISLALRENAFAAPVVKLQEERRQRVIDSGPYRLVRHPMYAGAVPLMVGMPLWLQSYAGTLLALVPIGIVALRIRVEEQFLRRELEGYDAYTRRVRYRLIPFVW